MYVQKNALWLLGYRRIATQLGSAYLLLVNVWTFCRRTLKFVNLTFCCPAGHLVGFATGLNRGLPSTRPLAQPSFLKFWDWHVRAVHDTWVHLWVSSSLSSSSSLFVSHQYNSKIIKSLVHLPHWPVPLVWGSRSSSLSIIIITDLLLYAVVNFRQMNFSWSPLPVSGTNYHATSRLHRPLYEFSAWQSSEDSSFQPFLSQLSVVFVKWHASLSDTLIAFVTYLFVWNWTKWLITVFSVVLIL